MEPLLNNVADVASFQRQLIPPHVEQHPPVNYNAKASIDPAGKDLPFNDLQTMVYFYNLGVEVRI